jgi:hypothetical protein
MSGKTPFPASNQESSPFLTPAHVVFGELIDYAGLFPPAQLDMAAAVAEYRAARSGRYGWVLGRFLCPTPRLAELAGELTRSMVTGEPAWKIGAIFDTDPASSAGDAQAFTTAMAPAATIVLAESPLPAEAADGRPPADAAQVINPNLRAAASISPELSISLEVPRTSAWRDGIPAAVQAIAALAGTSHRDVGAKLRCGGLEPSQFPSVAQVACFIGAAAQAEVAFKATAGLHHPVRHLDPELGGYRHGFLNLLTATSLAVAGEGSSALEAAISEEDPAAFQLAGSGLSWQGRRIGTSVLQRTRRDAFTAYGSCSFNEPISDLIALGFLGDES